MKELYKLIAFFIFLSINVLLFAATPPNPARSAQEVYVPNKLIIKYKSIQPLTQLSRSVNAPTNKDIEIVDVQPVLRNQEIRTLSASNQLNIDLYGINRIYEITFKSKKSINAVIESLKADENIEYAEPVYAAKTFATPNDPFYNSQGYLKKVKAPEAWNIQDNANGIIVAVVDSGSELDHPDLATNIYINTGEIPDDGIDNDGDGFIDNYYGWDFGGSTLGSGGDKDPSVKSKAADHGVHVSGLVSAVTNNGIGVASIAKNAKLLVVKVGVDDDAENLYYGYQGIMYSVLKGAKIINCSWGSSVKSSFGQDVIDYAISKGCLVVAAAGNSGNEVPIYPAAYSGVLAVSNVQLNDVKSSSSSYGYHVGIAAPGTVILNTVFGKAYDYKSGTSMACPLVSSASALVWAKYPNLSPLQVAEVLKQSADDIYNISENQQYINKLGTGRLNVEKALQTTDIVAVKQEKIILEDISGALNNGAEVNISAELLNVLGDIPDLVVELGTLSSKVTILDHRQDVGFFLSQSKKTVGNFKIKINGAAENEEATFYLQYSSNSKNYQAKEYFTLKLNRDFINYQANAINTTLSSNGRLGYANAEATEGQGFRYKGNNMLYEASLMIGTGPAQVSNNTRNGDTADEDFVKKQKAERKDQGVNSYFNASSVFTDKGSSKKMDIEVTNTHIAFPDNADKNFVVVEYDIKNSSTSDLTNVYAGMFVDWDINNAEKNVTRIDQSNKLAYVYEANVKNLYGGTALLTKQKLNYYPLSHMIQGDLGDGDFTIDKKFTALSSGIYKESLGENYVSGVDIMYVLSAGPFNIKKGESEKVAFMFSAGNNLNELKGNVELAQTNYSNLEINKPQISSVYSNPVSVSLQPKITIEVKNHEKSAVDLAIYDILGRKMQTVFEGNLNKGEFTFEADLRNLSRGVYYVLFTSAGKKSSFKIMVD